jgi:chromosomal replication initiation ATPase DnaA
MSFPSLQVLAEVAAAHGFSVMVLRSNWRGPSQLFAARQEAAKRLRTERGLSLNQIGRFLGGRDHSTVLRMVDDDYRRRQMARMTRRDAEQRRA